MTRMLSLGLALLLLQGTAHAAGIGRLFLTQSERDALDAARQGSIDVRQTKAAAPLPTLPETLAPSVEPPQEPITVNGYVTRSAGVATVWVNGRDGVPGKLAPPTHDGQRVKVPLGRGGSEVALKPGESFDPGSRQVSDAYQQRPAPE